MNKQKEARPDVGASERAKETGAASRQATTSNDHDTTASSPGQAVKIADFLSPGADHGLHLSDLVRLTDLPERTVRLVIRMERLSGTPILEDSRNGYFLPSSDHERARCVQRLRRRAAEIVKAADAIEGAR